MKKVLCILIVTIMVMALFVGCGGNTTGTQSTAEATSAAVQATTQQATAQTASKLTGKIDVAIWNNQKTDALTADAKDFMAKHPGTEINIEYIEKIDTIKTRMAANDLPDIAQVPHEVLKNDWPTYYLPIEDIGFTPDNLYFYDSGVGPDNHLYNLTATVAFQGIVYNKTTFAKAGITATPKTMDEFYADCDKLKAAGIIPFACNFKDGWPLDAFIFNVGPELSGDKDWQNNLATKPGLLGGEFLQGCDWLRGMEQKGYLEPDLESTSWGGFIKDIDGGKTGMAALGSWFPPQMANEADRGMFPFPGAKCIPMNDDWHMGIAKTSASPDLAKAYFKHLFLDGAFYPIMSFDSPVKGSTYPESYIKELTSSGLPGVAQTPSNETYTAVNNAFAIDFAQVIQDYLTTKDTASVIKKYNDKWAEAVKNPKTAEAGQ